MPSALSSNSTTSRIVRAMGVFSGVKILGILCSLVRNKLIALFIGPAGLGLIMLYNTFVDLISQLSRVSMDQSAQRDISQASDAQIPAVVAVVRRWAIWLGLAGTVFMCVTSPLLSWLSWGTVDHWGAFCILSVIPLCYSYITCTNAINQGLRRFKALALANVLGTVTALAATVPLIIWLGIDSIVWVIVIYAVLSWAATWLYRPRIRRIVLPRPEIMRKGRSFIRLGAQISIATALSQVTAYVFVIFLNTYADTDTLGLYQAGFTVMNSYVGIIFMALWVEYYPRLSAMAHSTRRLSLAASHQTRLTLFILAPLLCLLAICAKPVILLVYSSDFLPITTYIRLCCIGVVFRTTSWCLAYVILARGDGRAYLVTETLSCFVGLAANIAGYLLGGFTGLGIAYIAWYVLYTCIVAIACRRFGVRLSAPTWLVTTAATALTTITALLLL